MVEEGMYDSDFLEQSSITQSYGMKFFQLEGFKGI